MAPDDGGKPGGSDKPPGLELFKGDDAFEQLKARYHELKKEGWDFEFVLAKYKES